MYQYIKGEFININKDYVVIDNRGIGYKIFTSGNTMASMPKCGEVVLLYVEQIVREDFIGLYGFLTEDELSMFKMLLSINGVGSKAALSLLSISTVSSLKYAIYTGDEKTIVKAPGVGKKTAQRIILELKDKIKLDEALDLKDIDGGVEQNPSQGGKLKEALEALEALGYTEKEAEKALLMINKEASLEEIIKECLRYLMN